MKNEGIKITILLVLIIIAVAGILAFYPTIVAPPTDVPIENLHRSSVQKDIDAFSELKKSHFNDSIFIIVFDKIILYKTEAFLTESEIDYQIKSLISKYLPIFTNECYSKFGKSVWKDSDHKNMLSRIAQLRSFKVDYGQIDAVTGTYNAELQDVEKIIDNYGKAKEVANYSIFLSVSDANNKIRMADEYKAMDYLKNCTDLVSTLSSVKTNIGTSHYNYVASKVNEMAGYKNMTETDFNSLVAAVNSLITEYNNNRQKYGSSAKTIDDIKRKVSSYYAQAQSFYTKEEINIISSSQWGIMASPNTSYRAYRSESNYHKASSASTLSFTIKGYEKFTFHIRSDGEKDYDYVIVGLNNYPTTESSYTSTKGSPQSGTAFYNYKTVL